METYHCASSAKTCLIRSPVNYALRKLKVSSLHTWHETVNIMLIPCNMCDCTMTYATPSCSFRLVARWQRTVGVAK